MSKQKILIGVLGLLLLAGMTVSGTIPFKQYIQVKAAACGGADGTSCTTDQSCPGVCYSGVCGDIADNCPTQTFPPAGDNVINNPLIRSTLRGSSGASFFAKFIPNLITLGLIIGALFFFFIFVIGAIQWISSGGDKNALEEAKHKVTNAIIGIVILFSIFAVLKLIENFFGISILTLDIGSLVI